MSYEKQYNTYLAVANNALEKAADDVFNSVETSQVAAAARYSLFSGGKRARAVLCIAVCDMLNGNIQLAAEYASAVEMLHCYSLIHDDLPCMDNDDYRRGKPSCHKKYGETTALLAGDALLTASFEVLCSASGTPQQNVMACKSLSTATGTKGMILGQELDLHFENSKANEHELKQIHKNKTGKLIESASILGTIAANNASDEEKKVISNFAFNVGLVFQIIDDILDVTADEKELGKPIGSDDKSDKTTFVKLFGLEKSTELAEMYTVQTCDMLIDKFGNRTTFLVEFAQKLLNRRN